jgi:hypothetical protein
MPEPGVTGAENSQAYTQEHGNPAGNTHEDYVLTSEAHNIA